MKAIQGRESVLFAWQENGWEKHRKDRYPHGDETNGYMTVTDRKMKRQKNVTNNKRKKMLKNTIKVLKKKRMTDIIKR